MNKYVEIAGVVTGAVIGALVHGAAGITAGAVLGGGFALLGRKAQEGYILRSSEVASMKETMHVALAAAWGVQPLLAENGGTERERIRLYIDEKIIAPRARELRLNRYWLVEMLDVAIASGIAPYESLRFVRKSLTPRLFRKDTSRIDALVTAVLEINAEYGNYAVSREWFCRWMDEIGVGQHAERLWNQCFEGTETRDLAAERTHAMVKAYLAEQAELLQDEVAEGE